jgi:hypothetical protein
VTPQASAGDPEWDRNPDVRGPDGKDRHRDHSYHEPSGTEPRTARSAIGLRRVLATLALVGTLIAAFFFWRASGDAADAALIICLIVALSAALDLAYLSRRYPPQN